MPVAAPLIGAAGGIGAAMLGKPKAAKDANAYLRPYMNDAASQAQGLFQQGGPDVWSGSTVAGMGGTTQAALQAQLERAQGGSPLIDQAQGFVQQGLNAPISSQFGDAQNPYASTAGQNPYATSANPFGQGQNPGLDAAFNYAAQKSQNQLTSEFARGGRNIDASAPARADILSSLAAQIYAPAYESERNRQLAYGQQQLGIGADAYSQGQQIGATGFESAQGRQLQDIGQQRSLQQGLLGYSSPLAAQDYMDIAQQRDVGATYDQQSQAQLTDRVNQFNQQQQRPYQNLQNYVGNLTQLAGGTAQYPTQPNSPNYLSAALGGAMLGKELYPGLAPDYGHSDLQQQQLQWLQSQQQPIQSLF